MRCPKCDAEIEELTALHQATEEWAVRLGDDGKLEYDYLTTYHDGEPMDSDGDVIQCPECQEEFTVEEAKTLLAGQA